MKIIPRIDPLDLACQQCKTNVDKILDVMETAPDVKSFAERLKNLNMGASVSDPRLYSYRVDGLGRVNLNCVGDAYYEYTFDQDEYNTTIRLECSNKP